MPPEKMSVYCPYCLKHTSLEPALGEADVNGRTVRVAPVVQSWRGTAWIATCNACENFLLVEGSGPIHPTPQPAPTDERIHEPCREALDEAKRCMTVNAPNASATMSRRAIQGAAVEKKAPQGSLVKQIEWMAQQGLITRDLAEWAHEVRFIGNDGAHEVEEDVTEEEAQDALDLAEQFLTVLYVAPAIARERKEKRQSKPELRRA